MRSGDSVQARYDLLEEIGEGGMGEVWRARDTRLNREVAIKFLLSHSADDPENLVRFFAEAQSVARIHHPNVVTVLDFGEIDDRPYLVMEFVPGGSLTDVTNGDPILPERALEIIGKIAGAAGAAHSLGIVHRDIKPANILLDDEGHPKLCDFGIASSARDAERLTATGVAIGSPHYLSPEQAAGVEALPASDVYSLGVVLYELLTGVRPFGGNNVTAIAIAHIEREAEPPSVHLPGLSSEMDHLVLTCLQKAPEDRFQDGNELHRAIEALENEEPESTGLMPVGEPAHAPSRSYRRLALVAAVLLAITSFAVFRGVFGGDATPERADAQTDSGGSGQKKGGRDSSRGTEPVEATDPAPTTAETPADDEEAEEAPVDDAPATEDEGAGDEEAEPEPTPSVSETPAPEQTPTPDVETPSDSDPPTDLD